MYIQMDFNSCEDTSYMQQTGLGLPMMDNPSPVFLLCPFVYNQRYSDEILIGYMY
ncbi:hypothetical protein EDO6_04756 [Paenibacillus xylanexedens]|nr:hypothetical protein EDO6_04756 [Paenibacillus xylanexedens]